MNRTLQLLLMIVAVEVAALAWFGYSRFNSYSAPIPSMASIDSLTASELENLARECKSGQDWHDLANAYMSAGFFAEADVCYGQAIQLDTETGDGMYHRGFCQSRFGKTKSANENFLKVIEMEHPRSAEAAYFMGRNHLRDEEPELAKSAFQKAGKIPMAQFELARIHFRQGYLDEAKKNLANVLSMQPDASRAKLLMSEIGKAQNSPISAISFSSEGSEQTVRLGSPFKQEKDRLMKSVENYGIEREKARLINLVFDNELEEARNGLEAMQDEEWSATAQEALIQIAMSENQPAKVESLIKEQLAREGPTTIWLVKLGEVRMLMNNPQGALEAWQKGVQVRNDQSLDKCYSGLGKYYESKGDQNLASKYQHLLMLDLARKSIRKRDYAQAMEMVRRADDAVPGDAETHYLFGKTYRLMFNPTKAQTEYQKCLSINPSHGKAIRELALVKAMQD